MLLPTILLEPFPLSIVVCVCMIHVYVYSGVLWCMWYVCAQVCSDVCEVCVCPGVLWCVWCMYGPRCALMCVVYVFAQVCSDVCDAYVGLRVLWCVWCMCGHRYALMCDLYVVPGVLWCMNGSQGTVLWRLLSPFTGRWALGIELSLQAFETNSSPAEPCAIRSLGIYSYTCGQQLLSQLTLQQLFVISTSGSPTFLLSKAYLRGLCTKLSPAEMNKVFALVATLRYP